MWQLLWRLQLRLVLALQCSRTVQQQQQQQQQQPGMSWQQQQQVMMLAWVKETY
jgi:hypothetical protein